MLLDLVVITLTGIGCLLFVGGTIGILRLPDAYTRLHMAGKLDTLGSLCLLIALAAYAGTAPDHATWLVQIKILLLWIFVFLTSPTATHAMVDAALRAGLEPWMRPGDTPREMGAENPNAQRTE